jgi:predicted DNA-binding protein YlxM (UPF0122 family)
MRFQILDKITISPRCVEIVEAYVYAELSIPEISKTKNLPKRVIYNTLKTTADKLKLTKIYELRTYIPKYGMPAVAERRYVGNSKLSKIREPLKRYLTAGLTYTQIAQKLNICCASVRRAGIPPAELNTYPEITKSVYLTPKQQEALEVYLNPEERTKDYATRTNISKTAYYGRMKLVLSKMLPNALHLREIKYYVAAFGLPEIKIKGETDA